MKYGAIDGRLKQTFFFFKWYLLFSHHSSTEFTKGDELNAVACTQAFQRHRHDLALVIDHLLSYMTCKDLLPESTKERVELPSLSRMERSVLVLDAIEARIIDNPSIFHTFITVLQKDSVLQRFAGSLIESYRKSMIQMCFKYHYSRL